MLLRQKCASGVAALALAGCASSPKVDSSASAPAATSSAAASNSLSGSPTRRWTGNLNPTTSRTGQVAATGSSKTFGTVNLTVAESSENRSRARITLTAPVSGAQLKWALLPGRCGSGAVSVMAVELFPVLDVGTSGRTDMDVEFPFTLPSSGTYHVNVYWPTGQQLNDVMTCENLLMEAR